MYRLKEIKSKGLQFIEISSPSGTSKAQLCLNQGGRLSYLKFNNSPILTDFDSSTYTNNYASAILFPFANRIKDGKYSFRGVDYILECNEIGKTNAIHGLVYNKTFECIKKTGHPDYGAVTLRYKHNGELKGFPFKFHILLTYTLNENTINLEVKIINKDVKTFPFTLGWHPYFASKDLDESVIGFESKQQFLYDEHYIISGSKRLDSQSPRPLKGVKLDNGYKLETNSIEFTTPEYLLKMMMTAKENYLQLYTPNTSNSIAIEPMTGPTDSFNNKIGLRTLGPSESFTLEWNIAIENSTDKMNTN